MPEVSMPTLETSLGWVAYGLRQSLVQAESICTSYDGVREVDLLGPGWPMVYTSAVQELWAATGGPKIGQYVLARQPEGLMYRRYRIVTLDEDGDGYGIGTEAWSAANEKRSHDINIREAIYIG